MVFAVCIGLEWAGLLQRRRIVGSLVPPMLRRCGILLMPEPRLLVGGRTARGPPRLFDRFELDAFCLNHDLRGVVAEGPSA